MRTTSFLVIGLFTVACGPGNQPAQGGATWAVNEPPMLAIVDVPGHELSGVSSALRLANGQILVANSGVPELELFDATGRFVRPIGRKGQGPGEFQGPISVFGWRADSVAVYDPATMRWTILSPGLALARTAPDSAIRQPTWLYQGLEWNLPLAIITAASRAVALIAILVAVVSWPFSVPPLPEEDGFV